MATRSLTEAASASLNRLTIINRDVQNLFENGVADSIDLLETELALEKGKQLLDQRRRDEANASAVLSRLIDLEENETINLMDTIIPPSQSKYQELLSRAVIKRPELDKFDYMIGAAEHAMDAEKGAYVPTLSGFAGYSYGMPNRDWFNKTWNDYFTVGLTLHWQLNLGGKTARNVDAARMRTASIRANRGDLHKSLLTGRDMAANNLRFSYDAYRISSNEFNIATRRFHLARLRQEAGQISVNRLLEMEADLTATEQQLRAATVQYYLAENEYLYAIGSDQLYGGLK
jgi:outer membrane protein TolC